MGVAEFNHAGTFGVFDHAAFQRHGAQFIRRTAAWPHGKSSANSANIWLAVLVGGGTGSGKALGRSLPVPLPARWSNACL
jgi:hypothetical protein